ncbi:MAG: DUF262 domain-containing protein [Hyphomicrobiaceae bacterium]|nr:DUF262 domain-containing protein [Hyphomicrobiaceae bacterium]
MFARLQVASVALGELFAHGSTFSIPSFQRPFDWGPEEALQLLDDVSRAAGIDAPDSAEPDYFLGTLLLLAEEAVELPGSAVIAERAEGVRHSYEVIDGQQRLTTLTMLFAILRDLGVGQAYDALQTMVALGAASGAEEASASTDFRLTLNGVDRALFRRHVQRVGANLQQPGNSEAEENGSSSSRILDARDALVASLSQLDAGQRKQLADFLLEKCHVVVTLSHDIDRAHRLFTVLNERGKPLRRNDIIKVEVLGGLSPFDADHARRRWEAAEAQLGGDFEAFFGHLKAVYGRRRATVVTGLRSLIAEAGGARAFIDKVLVPYIGVFVRIRSCQDAPSRSGDELSERLHYLNRLRGEEWLPAVMVALHKYGQEPDRALGLVRAIDRLAHLSRVQCQGGGRRTTRFNRVVQAIQNGSAVDETAEVFELNREELRNAKFNLRNLHRRNPPVCKLLLMRISDQIQGRLTPIDPATLSVEHVLPVRPSTTSAWRSLYPEPEVREAATQCLGNLTLLPERLNDKARNRSFEEKRVLMAEHYRNGPMMEIVHDVVTSSDWSLNVVAARERRFLNALSGILGVEVSDAAMEPRIDAAE